MADVTPLRAPHEAGLADRVGREVVVVHEPPLLLEREVVDPLTLLGRAEREQGHDLRLAPREQRGAVGSGGHADLALDRADLVGRAAVRPALLDGDLLPNELLVDRLGRTLDELAREAVLDGRCVSVDRRRPDREAEIDRVDDAVEEERPLRRLELLRVLLGLGQRLEVVLELLPNGLLDGRQADLVEQHVQRQLVLELAEDVFLRRAHVERWALLIEDLLDDRAAFTQALVQDLLADPVRDALLQVGRELRVEPLGLADLLAEILLRLADLDDLGVRELERLEKLVLGDLLRASLDHRQAVLRADDDQVEGALLHLLERRVDGPLVALPADPDCSHRADERQRRDHQRGRGAVDAEDVVRRDHVRRQDGADHLHLVLVALRPERPDRAVDHPRGQDRPLGGAPLALEEAAGDLARGVHPLLDVDGEREEVGALTGLHPALGRRQHHRVARTDDHGAVGLLGQLPRLERKLLPADLDRDSGRALYCDAHLSSTLRGEWRFGSRPTAPRITPSE